jgi:hypothetical protein
MSASGMLVHTMIYVAEILGTILGGFGHHQYLSYDWTPYISRIPFL